MDGMERVGGRLLKLGACWLVGVGLAAAPFILATGTPAVAAVVGAVALPALALAALVLVAFHPSIEARPGAWCAAMVPLGFVAAMVGLWLLEGDGIANAVADPLALAGIVLPGLLGATVAVWLFRIWAFPSRR